MDSVINTKWVDDFNWKLQFDHNDSLLISGYRNSKAQYQINDTLIAYRYVPSTDWYQLRYEYYKDSLVLHSNGWNFIWSADCYLRMVSAENSSYYRWVYYSEDYLRNKPLDFEKIQISGWNGILEIDCRGNIFYDVKNHGDFYGHYRGKLPDDQLQIFLKIVEKEQLRIKLLACGSSYSNRSHSRPPIIKYITNSKTYILDQYLEDLQKHGFKTFDFITDHAYVEKLKFQNYADGDSLSGLVSFYLPYRDQIIATGKPQLLHSYTDGDSTSFIYKLESDSVQMYPKSRKRNFYRLLYFRSNKSLPTNQPLAIVLGESTIGFYPNSNFYIPKDLPFFELNQFKTLPVGYSIYTSHAGGMMTPERIFPIIKKSSKRHFEKAFEEYVFPDWEAYLKKQETEKNK